MECLTIANQMALAAMLRPICGIWPSQQPPKTARTEQLSTTARDQSIWPSRQSQSNNKKWIKSQIPSCCQSRNRRQQLIPEPQPSLCGSIRQGIPLRRPNAHWCRIRSLNYDRFMLLFSRAGLVRYQNISRT
jgi:hypothetical protein